MSEKKSFFASLDSKSALVVGLVAGVLVICSIGFLVMLGLYFSNKTTVAKATTPSANVADNSPAAQQPAPQPVAVTKSDRPKVELFVMAYCPYGLQMEKAYLPAWDLLKNKADIDVKFVSYAMHGQKEVEENTRQYCIEKDQPAKYQAYLKCFTGSGDFTSCLTQTGMSESSLASCVNATNKTYKTMDLFKDQTTWLSGRYPQYPVHADLNTKYGVQGSPTLVINGAQVDNVGRTAEAVKQAICASFNNPPAECQQTLPNTAYQPGFGTEQAAAGTGANAGAACGS